MAITSSAGYDGQLSAVTGHPAMDIAGNLTAGHSSVVQEVRNLGHSARIRWVEAPGTVNNGQGAAIVKKNTVNSLGCL